MKLRYKTSLIIIGLWTVMASAIFFVSQRLILHSFTQLEQQDTQEEVIRIHAAIDQLIDSFSQSVRYWANWTPAYQFVTDKNSSFIQKNFSLSNLSNINVDIILIFDPMGNFVSGVAANPTTNKIVPIPVELTKINK